MNFSKKIRMSISGILCLVSNLMVYLTKKAKMNFNEKSLKYNKPFIDNPNNQRIHNVKTKIITLEIGGFIFPVSINKEKYGSSYVCSPYNSYVTY